MLYICRLGVLGEQSGTPSLPFPSLPWVHGPHNQKAHALCSSLCHTLSPPYVTLAPLSCHRALLNDRDHVWSSLGPCALGKAWCRGTWTASVCSSRSSHHPSLPVWTMPAALVTSASGQACAGTTAGRRAQAGRPSAPPAALCDAAGVWLRLSAAGPSSHPQLSPHDSLHPGSSTWHFPLPCPLDLGSGALLPASSTSLPLEHLAHTFEIALLLILL